MIHLERWGLGYFRRRDARLGEVVPDDDIHYLNERERQDLRRIQWQAMTRAGIAGAISAALVAIAELYLLPAVGLSDEGSGWSLATFYGALLLISGFAALVEIAYLYYDALRSVHDLARAAGLCVAEGPRAEREVAAALARAALELPDPREPVFGVDPSREVSGWRLVAASGLYKAKIAMTSFVLKAVLRRALGRAMVRSWLPFVAVPVTAAWNVAVAFMVLREARLRVMGPSAARAVLDETLPRLPEGAQKVAVRAVAATIVKKHRMHPNHRCLLAEVHARVDPSDVTELDAPGRFLDALDALPPELAQPVLRIFAAALVLDGRLSSRDRALLEAAAARGPRPSLPGEVRALRRAFVRGHGLGHEEDKTITPMADAPPERV